MIKINRPSCPNPSALQTSYKHRENKTALQNANHDKCMYCESKISHIYYGDVEHIKPKSKYPALEFQWENLGYVCAKCNNHKSDKFDDNCPFINPYEENPSDFIVAIGEWLYQFQGNERGQLTILDIGLNKDGLLERRRERLKSISDLINSMTRTLNPTLKAQLKREIEIECANDKPYSLAAKNFAKQLLGDI